MPKFKIRHITRYIYDAPVRDSANQIMLYPLDDPHQKVLSHKVFITGNPDVAIYKDNFDNDIGTFTHSSPHEELTIDSRLEVVTTNIKLPLDTVAVNLQWDTLERLRSNFNFLDFLRQEHFNSLPDVEKVIREEQCKDCTPLQLAKDMTSYIYKNFKYQKGITTVETTPDEIWKLRSGVCQDFAHILLVMLRSKNIPARYVSGYICPNKAGMRGEGATHAWAEAYIPEMGWIGFDPTNNCIVNEMHVRLAVGKNFTDCSPVKGTYRGSADHTLEVTVKVDYENGQPSAENGQQIKDEPEANQVTGPVTSYSKNSFRRYQEMQMQQQ
jgi:transglutaminase-like putative cysteine protease